MRIRLFCAIFLILACSLNTGCEKDSDVVEPQKLYESSTFYDDVEDTLSRLHDRYRDITAQKRIGQSADGRDIRAIKVGRGKKEIFINGAFHAREYITAVLTLQQAEYLCMACRDNRNAGGYNARKLLDRVSVWFVPLVNPDGAELCKKGVAAIRNVDIKNQLLKYADTEFDFSSWKANARGVDLNDNYDAGPPGSYLKKYPAGENYPGPSDYSEPETKALVSFCREHEFQTMVSYHAAGEIIYWYFYQEPQEEERDKTIAKELARLTGYREVSKRSFVEGKGFRNWFVLNEKKPGYVIEVGKGSITSPPDFSAYFDIWLHNRLVPFYLMQESSDREDARQVESLNVPAG